MCLCYRFEAYEGHARDLDLGLITLIYSRSTSRALSAEKSADGLLHTVRCRAFPDANQYKILPPFDSEGTLASDWENEDRSAPHDRC